MRPTPLFLAALATCSCVMLAHACRGEPPAEDPEELNDGFPGGVFPGFEGPSSDSAGQDETGWHASDTGWLASLPVHDCPGPPDGAIEVDIIISSTLQQFFDYEEPSVNYSMEMFGVDYTLESCPEGCRSSDFCFFHGTVDGTAKDGFFARVFMTMDKACPLDYQTTHTIDYMPYVGMPGFTADVQFWWSEDQPAPSLVCSGGRGDRQTDLCLSRVRPQRIQGTILFHPLDTDVEEGLPGVPIFVTFDAYDNGTFGCFLTDYEHDLTEKDVWLDLCADSPAAMEW